MPKKEIRRIFEKRRWSLFVDGIFNLAKDFDIKLSSYTGLRNVSIFDCSFTERVYTKEREFRTLPYLKSTKFFEDEESLAIVDALKNKKLKYDGKPPLIEVAVCNASEVLGYITYHSPLNISLEAEDNEKLERLLSYFD